MKIQVDTMRLLFIALLLSFSIPNLTAQTKTSSANRYDIMDMRSLPIGMWVTPTDQYRNEMQYRRIAKAGINFVNGFCPYEDTPDKIETALDLCAKYGLKYFVNRKNTYKAILSYADNPDNAIIENIMTDVKNYLLHPAYAGELFFDEPGKPLFSSVKAFTKQYEKLYPDKMWHINLFPTYATGGIKTTSYEDYISSWFHMIDPGYLSYDSYPLLKTGGIIQDYFYNLDFIRAKTLEKRIPFWTFIQTLSIAQTPGVPDKRDPSEAEIRWQVWINLAFGAKGIQYFCYWSPESRTEDFGDALITREGEKTDKYKYVQRLNSDIKKTGKILLDCDAVGAIQTTVNPYSLYEGNRKSFGPVKGISGDDNIAGCFTDKDGVPLILISPLIPNRGATVKLILEDDVDYATIIRGKKEKRIKIKNQELVQTLSAGDAVLIKF